MSDVLTVMAGAFDLKVQKMANARRQGDSMNDNFWRGVLIGIPLSVLLWWVLLQVVLWIGAGG